MTSRILIAVASSLIVFLAIESRSAEAKGWPGCSHFASQPQAQRAWIAAGRPPQADRDRDGRVCEGLPARAPRATPSCVRTKRVIDVGLSRTKYPNVLAHARRAIRDGWPRIMVLNRPGADTRRERLLANVPTRRGFDRDEYPMAVGRGRGPGLTRGRSPTGWKADVAYVPSSENRGAGSVAGIKLRRYCNGIRFRYIGY